MFKKYPFIKQYGEKDCASACVWMITKYYRGNINMNKLSLMLKTTKEGTTAYHIVETLKNIGFNAKGIKEETLETTKIPFIAHVIIKNTHTHYIVVYEINKSYILIADPADKIKKISRQDFYKMWTGIKIVMYPQRLIIKEKNISVKEIIKTLLFSSKLTIIKIGLLSILTAIFGIIGAFFFQILIDNMQNIKIVSFIFIFIILLNLLLTYYRNLILANFTSKINKKLSFKTVKQIINLPYLYYHNHTTGDMVSRINDLSLFTNLLGKVIITLFIDLPLSLFTILVLIKINFMLTFIIIIIMLLYILIIALNNNKLIYNIDKVQRQKAIVNSYLVESISGFETVKGLNIEQKIQKNLKNKYNHYINSNLYLDKLAIKASNLKDFVNLLGQALIMILGIYLVKQEVLRLSEVITFISLSSLFLEPIRNIIELDIEIKKSINALRRIFDLICFKNQKTKQKLKGDIKFNNVYYSYDKIKNTLENINLEIKKGTKVLITGVSGSGKSTLLKIIKGYYKYSGNITVGDKQLASANNIIYTSQNEILFTATLKDNLSLKGNKGINKNIKVCEIAKLIENLPLGLNTLIEENGYNFSAGQKQRLILARSLRDFDILLIDEGLNSLNADLERKVLKKLFKAYKSKTIIVVSHRLDNLDLFGQYVKLKDGKIILNEKYNY